MRLFIESDGTEFTIMVADDRMGIMPAGPRLFRKEPWPDVMFSHTLIEDAQADMAKMKAYFAGLTK